MRSIVSLSLPVAIAAFNVADYGQSVNQPRGYRPDMPKDLYIANGLALPNYAQDIMTIKQGQSYVVKLDCLGCPFRDQSLGAEVWQEPAQDNSLLLVFNIQGENLLLNGERIAPAAPLSLPLSILAFQTPANLTQNTLYGMPTALRTDSDRSQEREKYAKFELQYKHSLLATKDFNEQWVQFDVTGAHLRGVNPGSAKLDKQNQKMVQLLLHRGVSNGQQVLFIKDIQVVERKDRVQPLLMKCGKPAMVRTEYNPLEWDKYGKFGTLARSWHLALWKSKGFFMRNLPQMLVVSLLFASFSLVRWHIRRTQERKSAQIKGDDEAALLESDILQSVPAKKKQGR
ncbi:hypothetical protein K504DRAFT_484872 [Pleomassaria siparia CBS 279.74]|uniref:Uncharacterized protein n=1 Tax=Pleomassaria siparia CBS 279.74 TaxID=1314801 RepID=A0A6G1JW07_9PLEO|nr:hypothetical protein K504DRAFT_484872 [Pleomassaria siparia CBS 279.74]